MIKSTFSKNKRVKRKAFLALLFLYPSVLPGGVIVHLVFISTLKTYTELNFLCKNFKVFIKQWPNKVFKLFNSEFELWILHNQLRHYTHR